METAKPWLETARLGQKIVNELGLDHTNKLLNRWMAHRVAELMEVAKSALDPEERKRAQDECNELILRLWEKRMDWPDGGPLKLVLPALRKLVRTSGENYGVDSRAPGSDSSWADLLTEIKSLQSRETWVYLSAIIADMPKEASESARTWLNDVGDSLTEEERTSLGILADLGESVHNEDFKLDGEKIPFFGSLPPEERTRHVRTALKKIEDKRVELLSVAASRNEPLAPLEPDAMTGNISALEELHGEYFNQLYDQVIIAFEDDAPEADEPGFREDIFYADREGE